MTSDPPIFRPEQPRQINWHEREAVYSVDFEPICHDNKQKRRLATAGADNSVRIWNAIHRHNPTAKDTPLQVEFLAELTRHTAPVNIVRFSPKGNMLASAGDDMSIILWKPSEYKEHTFGESDAATGEPESWRVFSVLLGHRNAIYELAWSPDGRHILTGSIDNTARMWDVTTKKCLHVFTEHSHYVQGVAWDPLGQYLATQSSDRSVQIYQYKFHPTNGSVAITNLARHIKLDISRAAASISTTSSIITTDAHAHASANPASTRFRIYHDENLVTFFRRLTFTTDGALLLTPAGLFKSGLPGMVDAEESGDVIDAEGMGEKGREKEREEIKNTVYVYARSTLNKYGFSSPFLYPVSSHAQASCTCFIDRHICSMQIHYFSLTLPLHTNHANPRAPRSPIVHLPNHKKPSIAVRCNPVLFQLRESSAVHDVPSEVTTATGKGRSNGDSKAAKPLFALPYRMVYAVATQDAVFVYDTQQAKPIAILTGFHYATVTDLTWSPDGTALLFTSTDGYCSAATFDDGELGTPYHSHTLTTSASVEQTNMELDASANPKSARAVEQKSMSTPVQPPQPQQKRRIQPTFVSGLGGGTA
ncbi:WD40-repeat-containing domain protein [Jimgerdemannia flammicorona]|uniref:WD40-repeat-containing domain protein n=1 Tax=Jimgerdemannia flammicorona TaxID=994334 RepID=A0A433Q876_9FUNG|nr:WD40-repeat-containing domain protein [Jimgerdemannia flammicorona]